MNVVQAMLSDSVNSQHRQPPPTQRERSVLLNMNVFKTRVNLIYMIRLRESDSGVKSCSRYFVSTNIYNSTFQCSLTQSGKTYSLFIDKLLWEYEVLLL